MNQNKKDKIIFIGSSSSFISSIILQRLLKIVKDQKGLEVSCVIDSFRSLNKKPYRTNWLKLALWRAFNSIEDIKYHSFENFTKIAKRNNIPELSPEDYNINSPDFIEQLSDYANIVFSCANLKILKTHFIDSFEYCVNYHNSLLPKYRGVGATAISLYKGEKKTGFTYHVLNSGVDEGNILLSDYIRADNSKSAIHYEWEKTCLAANRLEDLFGLIKKRFKGIIQEGESSYYTKRDFNNLFTIRSPEDHKFSELQRMILIFGGVIINNNFVTDIESANKGIRIKDAYITIKRITHLPPLLYCMINYVRVLKG